jgi:hypothetical protein
MLTMFRHAGAQEASLHDIREARDRAVASLGVSFEDLREQAERGEFSGPRERMTWLAFKDLGQV